jgi:hypothetical protein
MLLLLSMPLKSYVDLLSMVWMFLRYADRLLAFYSKGCYNWKLVRLFWGKSALMAWDYWGELETRLMVGFYS